jgi:hypothetical protein
MKIQVAAAIRLRYDSACNSRKFGKISDNPAPVFGRARAWPEEHAS